MSGIEQLRAALADATALHGEVVVRATAVAAVRARARRRRTAMLGSVAGVLAACVVVALLALTGGPGDGRTAVPASSRSAPSSKDSALPGVAPGAVELAVPLEIRPVRSEHLSCSEAGPAVPAVEGSSCFTLDRPWLVLSRLDGVEVAPVANADGNVSDGRGSLLVTMAPADRAAFGDLTTSSVGQQIALVVGDRVWSAPRIASPIRGGTLQLDLPIGLIRELLADLGVAVD